MIKKVVITLVVLVVVVVAAVAVLINLPSKPVIIEPEQEPEPDNTPAQVIEPTVTPIPMPEQVTPPQDAITPDTIKDEAAVESKPAEKPKAQTPTTPSEPKGGEKKDGKVYVEGFGWVDPPSPGHFETVDMTGNGNIIGY